MGGTGHSALMMRKDSSDSICGSLCLHPANGRYFTDDSGRAIYVVGWELQDDARDKQITFDYGVYLDLLTRHGTI